MRIIPAYTIAFGWRLICESDTFGLLSLPNELFEKSKNPEEFDTGWMSSTSWNWALGRYSMFGGLIEIEMPNPETWVKVKLSQNDPSLFKDAKFTLYSRIKRNGTVRESEGLSLTLNDLV